MKHPPDDHESGSARLDMRTFLRLVAMLMCILLCVPARADEASPGLTPRALPGLVNVGLPAPSPRGFALAASVGGGWIEPMGQPPIHAGRLMGGLGLAYAPLTALAFGLDFSGRADFLSTPEQNAISEPRLAVRGLLLRTGPVRLGVEADVRFVGTSAPSIEWSATSPSMSALVAWVPNSSTWIGGVAGFHLDRSAESVPDPSALSAADRITLGASSSPSVRVGIGVSHHLSSVPLEVLGEFSADLLVGAWAPPIGQSPMTLTAGARHEPIPGLSLLAAANVELSARPSTLSGEVLVPIEPRLGAQLALSWSLEGKAEAPAARVSEPAATAAPAEPPPVPRSAVRGRVVDEAGQGLADFEVVLELPEGRRTTRTFADGQFDFADIEDEVEVRVRSGGAGYDPAQAVVSPGHQRQVELVLYSAVPAGQVRGTVVDLAGRPVAAQITIEPGNQLLEVRPDGTFNIELVPGEYRLRAEHPDFAPQGRVIVVVERGVVILHIALSP